MANEIRVTMTGEDKLSSSVSSATASARQDIERLGDTAKETGQKMARDFEGAFDSLGEGAGGAEQKFIGLSDSITGTQDVMEGLKTGNVAQLAMGFADLAGATEALWSAAGKYIIQLGKKAAAMATSAATTIADTAATVAHTVATFAAEAAAKAWAAAQWLLNAAMSANPIMLVVIAIAALVAAFILAWNHSETFRAIVTGAFDAVLGIVQTVWRWVSENWPLLLAILTGPIGLAVKFIVDNFDTIVGFVSGLPGRITNAASGMWDGIKDAFKSAVNWIIEKWNGLSFGIPGFDPPGPGPSFPGFTIRVPQIARLAQGGITTGPTLAIVGDNPGGREAIVPLPPGGSGGLGGVTIIVNAMDQRGVAEAVVRGLRDARRYGLTAVSA
ncbi:MAG: hypothetical protein AB7H92_14050 [Microbacteriaceae bacterium]